MEPSEKIFKLHTNCMEVILISETYDKILVLASNLGFKKFYHSNLVFRIFN